jgi:hypothetical protein
MQAEEEERNVFKSSTIMPRSPRKRIEAPIPTAPKKSKVRLMIEETEENDKPSTPTRPSSRPTAKPVETPSTNDAPEPPNNPSKMLLQTAIGMIKRSKHKIVGQRVSATLRDEVILELDDVINFMEALQAIEDNMATVKRELKEVKETIIETAKAAKSAPNTWATVAAMPRAPTHTVGKNSTKRASRSKPNADKREQRSKLRSLLREPREQHKSTWPVKPTKN